LIENISATIEDKFEDKAHNLVLRGKYTSNDEYSGAVTVKDLVVSGSKFELNLNQSPDGFNVSPSVTHKTENIAFKSKLGYPLSGKKSTIKFGTAAGFLVSGLYSGIGTVITLGGSKTLIDLEGVASYNIQNHEITARANHTLESKLIKFGLSYYTAVHSGCKIALDASFDSTLEKFNIVAGGKQMWDNYTTVKGNVTFKHYKKDTELRTGLSLKQQISPTLLATIGADLNTRALLGNEGGEPHSFGINFKFNHK